MAFHIKSEDRISLIRFAYPYPKALAIGLIGLISGALPFGVEISIT